MLTMYTIYKDTNTYFLKEWHILSKEKIQPGKLYVAISLEQARRVASQNGRIRIEPDATDPSNVVESWL